MRDGDGHFAHGGERVGYLVQENMLDYTLSLLKSTNIDNVPQSLVAELRGASIMSPDGPSARLGGVFCEFGDVAMAVLGKLCCQQECRTI